MYLIVNFFVLIILFVVVSRLNLKSEIKNDVYIYTTIVSVLIFHTFKDYSLLPDIPQYVETFNYICKNNATYEAANTMYKMKQGYYYLNKAIGFVWCDPRFFMFVIGVIVSLPYFVLVKKYNKQYAWLACLLYFLGFIQSTFVLRQHVAISLCVSCVPIMARTESFTWGYVKEIFLIIALVILAITIHPTAILFFVLVAFYYIRNIKLLLFLIISSIYIVFANLYDIALFFAESAGDYLQYMNDTEFSGWGTILFNWGIFIIATIFIRDIKRLQNHWMIMYKGLFLSAFLSLISLANVASDAIPRFIMYLNCFSCIFVPFVISNLRNRLLRLLFVIFFLSMYFFNFALSERSYINDCKLAGLL